MVFQWDNGSREAYSAWPDGRGRNLGDGIEACYCYSRVSYL